ncbi:MAG: alpha-glucan family phosphorylase [Sedimentisphaerales bacterium]|nr:alpha-glucan family phosphorylase [Sedimentisphaerales bacterium]
MDVPTKLKELSKNLYWAWHPEVVKLFRDLHPELWRQVNHNPIEFLSRLAEQALDGKDRDTPFINRLTQGIRKLHEYLEACEVWGAWHAGPLRAHPVAYFSAEFGIHESLPIYSGGLGVLAGDHLKAASDLGIPLVGVGLFYAYGYFDQSLEAGGWQREHTFSAEAGILPLEVVKDANGKPIRLPLKTESYEMWVGIWKASVGRNLLLLLDTNVEGNSEQDRTLTSQLYGGDRRTRIRQELVLGVGGMLALQALGIKPSVVHMNEGHCAFAVLALAHLLMERDGQSFDNVREQAAAMTVFTTHTAVAAGHDQFDPSLVEQVLGPLRRQLELSEQDFLGLGRVDPTNKKEPFSMTVLGLKMSRSATAVSSLHHRITTAMWNCLWPSLPQNQVPIGYITNGVHVGSWLAEAMAELYTKYLGPDWREKMHDPTTWAVVEEMDDVELWEVTQDLRAYMIDYVSRSVGRQERTRAQDGGYEYVDRLRLDPQVLTIGIARRFAQYKRLDLILRDLGRVDWLVNHVHRPMQIIFAGKAHPQDDRGKSIIQSVYQITQDPRFQGKVVFVENYDINVCRHLVQGIDLWINTPRRPLEACGTSGMKVAMNGGLNLSTLDGWWAEAYDGYNGFAVGQGSEHSNWDHQDHIDATSLYDALEFEVAPMFYDRDADGIPRGWVARQKHALRTLTWRFSARRMLIDYTLGCYLPAAGGLTSSMRVDTRLVTGTFTSPHHEAGRAPSRTI